MSIDRRGLLVGTAAASVAAGALARPPGRKVPPLPASGPPMGWNSWNSFATTITEAQARESARPEGSEDCYLALFNTTDKSREVGVDLRWIGGPDQVRVRDLWAARDLGVSRGRVAQPIGAHGAGLYRLSQL